MKLPLASALSILRYRRRLQAERSALHAELFAEAKLVIDTMVKSKRIRGFALGMVISWLERSSPMTVATFLEVNAAGKLPNLNQFANVLLPVIGTNKMPSEMLLRELLECHQEVEYDEYSMEEVIASLAAAHMVRTGMENEPLDDPGTPGHAESMLIFRLSFALRYQSNLVTQTRSNPFGILFSVPLPNDPDMIRFAIAYPDRIGEIVGVIEERPEADGAMIVDILTSPTRALSEGVL